MRRERNQYIFASELSRRNRSHHFRNAVLILLPLMIILLWAANATISRRILLKEEKLTILNLPPDLENYSILHISDLHGAQFGTEQKGIANVLGNTRYSCVVMTGDMLGEDKDVQPLLDLVAIMPNDVPKFLIPGDTDGPFIENKAHSSLSVYTDWAEKVQAAGVTILDRPVLVTREKGRIWFVPEELYALDLGGLQKTLESQAEELNSRATSLTADDAARIRALEYELERIESLNEIKKEFDTKDIQVVLTHTPLSEDYVSDMIAWSAKEEAFSMRYASLILAGHYNGGQWRIPFVGAIYVPELGWLPQDNLIQGLSYLNSIPQYISPGMGSDPHYEHQPGRVFNNPVITKITLTRKAER
ncbi:MAG: metallophosphoesterase [Clostridia bacterium]|nr:metallophosphoesterase [Clostridia bacterium]